MTRAPLRTAHLLAVAWTVALVLGLSLPGETLPEAVLLSFDKLLHFVAFFVLALLWLRAYPARAGRILAAGLLFAPLSEVYQHLMPIGRMFSPLDALADVVGLAVGLGVGAWWQRQRTVRA